MTLTELLVVAAVLGILAAIALHNVRMAQTRAKVSASKHQLRNLSEAIEVYHLDYGKYPQPRPVLPQDPFGVVASLALWGLTTPVAYISPAGFHDPFGSLRLQIGSPPAVSDPGDPFQGPSPGFNSGNSLLYFYYPHFAGMIGDGSMNVGGYATISAGPDLKDSFIVYYPFPASFPPDGARFGVLHVEDSVYEPTNGTVSSGDLAVFGGEGVKRRLVGGGEQ